MLHLRIAHHRRFENCDNERGAREIEISLSQFTNLRWCTVLKYYCHRNAADCRRIKYYAANESFELCLYYHTSMLCIARISDTCNFFVEFFYMSSSSSEYKLAICCWLLFCQGRNFWPDIGSLYINAVYNMHYSKTNSASDTCYTIRIH